MKIVRIKGILWSECKEKYLPIMSDETFILFLLCKVFQVQTNVFNFCDDMIQNKDRG